MGDGLRTAMSLEPDLPTWETVMRLGGVYSIWRTWLIVPFDPAAEIVLTRSKPKEVDPVGVPKVRVEAFCTVSVAPLGADDAPSTAKARVPTARKASSASGMRL